MAVRPGRAEEGGGHPETSLLSEVGPYGPLGPGDQQWQGGWLQPTLDKGRQKMERLQFSIQTEA